MVSHSLAVPLLAVSVAGYSVVPSVSDTGGPGAGGGGGEEGGGGRGGGWRGVVSVT